MLLVPTIIRCCAHIVRLVCGQTMHRIKMAASTAWSGIIRMQKPYYTKSVRWPSGAIPIPIPISNFHFPNSILYAWLGKWGLCSGVARGGFWDSSPPFAHNHFVPGTEFQTLTHTLHSVSTAFASAIVSTHTLTARVRVPYRGCVKCACVIFSNHACGMLRGGSIIQVTLSLFCYPSDLEKMLPKLASEHPKKILGGHAPRPPSDDASRVFTPSAVCLTEPPLYTIFWLRRCYERLGQTVVLYSLASQTPFLP